MDSIENSFDKKLLYKCDFFSSLKDERTREKDYSHAINVWNAFEMNTMGDYHDLYLKADVLLLAGVFEKFINTCLEYYRLDPCYYFSSPGLSWDEMLKMTAIELEFIENLLKKEQQEVFLTSLEDIVKPVKNICNRMNKPSKFIMHLDENKSYGWGMIQYLPYSGFKWLNKTN